ncbi:lipase family protein [Caballeronia novacaledonica]|uniref:Lipase family protein n=1 Tax=Caballeronia novacaledonica TaxID=1544861 RepID=A0ACB5QIT4_9BURK|nr:lipase family protein [Caballeronia novacaledonica]
MLSIIVGVLTINCAVSQKSLSQETPAPPVIVQNLPPANIVYRRQQVSAIRGDLVSAAKLALMTYSKEIKQPWARLEIPRQGMIFGENITVILVDVNDEQKLVSVGIRGTDNLDDTLHDLQIGAVQDVRLSIPIHAGFQSIAVGVLEKLHSILTVEQFKTYSFSLTGHSLGGAVAAIVSMYLYQEGSNVTLVATFGAPRFTTNEGARKYQLLNARTYRVVRCDDVVPFMPPPNFFGWVSGGYEANGNLLLLMKPPYFDYSVGIDVERDFTYQLRTELENAGKRELLAYGHRMLSYSYVMKVNSARELATSGSNDLIPISYTAAQQRSLCPPRLGVPANMTLEHLNQIVGNRMW